MGLIIKKQSIPSKRKVQRVVLFLDVRGYTRSVSENGLVQLARVIKTLYEECRKCINYSEFERFQGDEIMVVYTDPVRAVDNAFKIRDKVTTVLAEIGLDAGIGIHMDEVYYLNTRDKDFGYIQIGQGFNIAKRLESASYGGDITISEPVYRELDRGQKRRFKIKQTLKIKGWGIEIPVRVSCR